MIVSGFGGCRFEFDDRRIRPQSFELVVIPGHLIEHVNDEITVVEEDPA